MHLGFNVGRLVYLRHFAGIVEYALAQGIDVTLLCDHTNAETQPDGDKGYEYPHLNRIPVFRHGEPRLEAYASTDDLCALVKNRGIDAVVAIWKSPFLSDLKIRVPSVPVVQLQSGWDFVSVGFDVDLFDAVYGFSQEWIQWLADYRVATGVLTPAQASDLQRRILARYVCVGFSQMEQLKYIDRDEARRRLGIHSDRPVVALLPFPFTSVANKGRGAWSHGVYRRSRLGQLLSMTTARRWDLWPYVRHGWNDRAFVASLKAFCERNGALLVAKSRRKDRFRSWVTEAADITLYDECYYPATTLDLLLVADACALFYSSAISEAVYTRTSVLCISPTRTEWPPYGERMVVPALSDDPGSFYNWPGVVWSLRVPDAIQRLPRAGLDDFKIDGAARDAYMGKFFGPRDLDVAQRLVTDLQSRFGLS